MPDNIWKRSADPAARKKAYDAHQRGIDEREMRTKNVVKQSPWGKLRHKDGDFKKKR
jgi:hypothetical protein